MDIDFNLIREAMKRASSDPSMVAKSDQLEAGGKQVSIAVLGLALEIMLAEGQGRMDDATKASLHMAALVATAEKEGIAGAALGMLAIVIGNTLVDQWGSIEKVYENLDDPTTPLFPTMPIGGHCPSCDGAHV